MVTKDESQQISLFVLKGVWQMSNKSIRTLQITLKIAELNSFVGGLY